MTSSLESLRIQLSARGALSAPELSALLKVSQPTLSRLIKSLGNDVLRIGKAAKSRYALRRKVGSSGSDFPLYRLDDKGRPVTVGRLVSLQSGQWFVEATDTELKCLMQKPLNEGLFRDLPWFFEDLRPQGFLGRTFAKAHASEFNANIDPRKWNPDDIVLSLLRYGWDLPGDWVLGDHALDLAMRCEPTTVEKSIRLTEYPRLAKEALAGDPTGSSAGGEQPKFTCSLRDQGETRHVIVKFSTSTNTPTGNRWATLLHAEHAALTCLHNNGIKVAKSRILEADGRCFLESTRFDRIGKNGRKGLISLGVLDAGFYGLADTRWTVCADRLEEDGWLSSESATRLRQIGWFGTLIANTDMHYGNFSLFRNPTLPLDLAPVYDMLPMLYAPTAGGELVDRPFEPKTPPPHQLPEWSLAAKWAMSYWKDLSENDSISDDFKAICQENLKIVKKLVDRLGV